MKNNLVEPGRIELPSRQSADEPSTCLSYTRVFDVGLVYKQPALSLSSKFRIVHEVLHASILNFVYVRHRFVLGVNRAAQIASNPRLGS